MSACSERARWDEAEDASAVANRVSSFCIAADAWWTSSRFD